MLRLAEVDGLDFERTSARRLDDDTWQVAGYATDAALAEIETRGLTAQLVVPAEQVAAEREVLYAAITREEPGAGDDPEAPPTSTGDDPAAPPTSTGDDPAAPPTSTGDDPAAPPTSTDDDPAAPATSDGDHSDGGDA
jgi:hypothetical protein